MSIVFSATFDPSPILAEAATLYEQYYHAGTAQPFDQVVCESAFVAWKDAIEGIFPDLVVTPKTVMHTPPRPPGVTDEEIAEVGAALARGYWPVT